MKILLLEGIDESAERMLKEAGHDVIREERSYKVDALGQVLSGRQVVGIRSKTKLTADVLAQASDLIAIGAFCIGTNQIDLQVAARLGIPVFNAPFSNTRSVAELVIAEIIMLSRRTADHARLMHEGKWRKTSKGSHEVRGKTLGIIGYGHIGRQLGVLAEAMGLHVLFFDILKLLPMGNNQPAELEQLLAVSDFVTLHVPETPQTKNMIGADEIARMKDGAKLLNLSRGTVVDLEALAAALKNGKLGGAAIDVFPREPKEKESDAFKSDLQGLPNVILTPHVGGSTGEAQVSIAHEVTGALRQFIEHGSTIGAVNFPAIGLPRSEASGVTRLCHLHKNEPGVLSEVNKLVAEANVNIRAQVLSTDEDIGYLIMDLDGEVPELARKLERLQPTIRVRLL